MAISILSDSDGVLLDFDATVSESHKFTSQVTEHPVERGTDPTDHIRNLPEKLTVEGLISATSATGTDDARTGEAFAAIERIREQKQLVKVITKFKTYENMVLTDADIPRTGKDGKALKFTLTFQRVVIVSNQTIALNTSLPKAKKKVEQGHKQGDADTDRRGILLRTGAQAFEALGKPVPSLFR